MKTLFKIIIVLIIIVVLIIGGGIFALNTSREVDVVWDDSDFQLGMDKSGIEIGHIEEINLETLVRGNFVTEGTNEVDKTFTSREMSALISMANNAGGPIKDVKVAFGDNGEGEISFKLSDNFLGFLRDTNVLPRVEVDGVNLAAASNFAAVSNNRDLTDFVVDYITNVANNKPVYANGELTKASADSINIKIDYLTVGRVPMTESVISRVEYETARIANQIISEENGFYIEELKVENGQLYYKGNLPAEIEGQRIKK